MVDVLIGSSIIVAAEAVDVALVAFFRPALLQDLVKDIMITVSNL